MNQGSLHGARPGGSGAAAAGRGDHLTANPYGQYSRQRAGVEAAEEAGVVTMAPIVYIVDDDKTSLWLLQEMLQGIGAQTRTYNSAAQFLDDYHPSPCECLITDLRMPEVGGLEVQRRLLSQGACLPIIFVSAYSEVSAAVAAIKLGAHDFLQKPVHAGELVEKVQAALTRSRELHAERLQCAARTARLALLTEREREVVELVVAGRSSREIAEQFALSPRTVENHRARAMEKLRVGSAIELARLFT